MRTNIVIDDDLIAQAMQTSGATTKREVVDLGLRALIRAQAYAELRSLRGKLQWEGDLDAMRTD
ncbi:transcription regulator of the Arc/MetJ class [Sphingomonas sp. Leaf357]|uniref:type II toxin-antitoxin system VapB family antitoxin n=1 Tax=Sphingomonas sp. Leaf357 TaxID=1736350 RepID=UPI0006F1F76E|nr:type II toxin-antitoxin system VapB family antitoxin [Sphingomonas sp. Leaf357]KQS04255.1 transcription regulator of the Arc/MetJ class [Sphingomonas sp. Leaf357]